MAQEQAYQDAAAQAVDDRVMGAGVSKEREDVILQKNKAGGTSIEGVIAEAEDSMTQIRDITLQNKTPLAQGWMKLCYAVGVKHPLRELSKEKSRYDSRAQMLEGMKEDYQKKKGTIDEDIKEAKEWVYDSDKILEEKDRRKEELEKELAYEAEEVKKCRAEYKSVEDKARKEALIEMVRGYEVSRSAKEKEIEDLEEEISTGSEFFNEAYEDLREQQVDRDEQTQMIQAASHLQRRYRRLSRSYGRIVEKSAQGKFTDYRMMAALAGELKEVESQEEALADANKKMKRGIAKIPEIIRSQKQVKRDAIDLERHQGKRLAEEEVKLAKERRANLYSIS